MSEYLLKNVIWIVTKINNSHIATLTFDQCCQWQNNIVKIYIYLDKYNTDYNKEIYT